MKVRRLAAVFSTLGALVLVGLWPEHNGAQASQTAAQALHLHGSAASGDKDQANALVKIVREATDRYRDVAAAEIDGYKLMFGCVSGPDWGAMGLHYVNMPLVMDGELDPARPEIVIYEPLPNGRLRLIGADYLVLADAWEAKNPGTTPQLMGQLLHYFESPNRFGLPNFYTLHVWAWKDNPAGMFVNWHTKVSCEGFSGQNQ